MKYCKVSCSPEGLVRAAQLAKPSSDDECRDLHPRCATWADLGECEENNQEMHDNCPKSCGLCDVDRDLLGEDEDEEEQDQVSKTKEESGCVDTHDSCKSWAAAGESGCAYIIYMTELNP